MMKKTIILMLTLCCLGLALQAQQTVPVSGGSAANGTGSFSFSLGQFVMQSDFEPAVSVHTVTASVIEGVQQPYAIDQLDIEGVTPLAAEIRVYPNPTAENVTIVVSDADLQLQYTLYGMNGVQLQQGVLQQESELHLSPYATGSYMLLLEDQQHHQNVYRIVKIR